MLEYLKYDVVSSLGYNCEISFRIEDYLGKIVAMPFSWSFVVERDLFPSAISNIDDLFTGDVSVTENHMFMCEKYKIKFHPRYSIFPQFGEYTESQRIEALEELKSRVNHLKDSFKELCASDKTTLFILKVEDKGDVNNASFIKSVDRALKERYITGKYSIAVMMLKKHVGSLTKAVESDHIEIFEVKRFAPLKHTNTMGDIFGWYKMFSKVINTKNHFFLSIWKRRWHWFLEVICRRLKIRRKNK